MPRSYDLNPVAITHHPTQRIDTAIGKLPPFDLQQIVDGFLTALKDLTGIDLTGIRDFLENLFGSIDWSNLPEAGDVWGSVVTTFINPLINIVQKINELFGPVFGGIDWTDPPSPEAVWQQVITTIISPLNLLLGPNSPLPAGNLVGQLRAALLGPLPIGMFTDEQLTMLREGGFDDPITIVEGSGYTHDATDGVPGSDPLGCARVECDGQWHIQSFALIKVAPGWTLTTPAQVKYESVVAAANSNAVRIELVPYNGTTPGAAVWMASDESPAGTVDWNDLNAWGQYVVPATGVTDVAVLTVVTPDATAGVVKFDNVDVLAIQKIPQAFTKDLSEDLASLLNFIQTWVHSALTALGITPSGGLLDDILDLSDELEFIQSRAEQGIADAAQALSDFTDFLSGGWQPLLDGVKGATGGGISDIINRLVNITSGGLFDAAKLSNVTGTAPQSLITGLTDLAAQSNQIGDILAGLVVTPINSTVQAIKDWFGLNIGKTQNLNSSGQLGGANIIGTIADAVVPGLSSIADGVNQAINGGSSTGNPLSQVKDDLTSFLDMLRNGFTGGSATGSTAADVAAAAADTANAASTAQQSTDTLTGYFNTPRLVAPWMATQADDAAFDVDKIDGTTAPSLGQIVLIPVKVVQDRIYDAIKFGCAATTMTNCYVGLYACDLSTGDLTKVLDLGDCKSQLDTAYNQQTIDIPDPIGVQRGEVYYIAVLQVGGTAAALHRSSSTTNFTTGLFPRYRGNVYATGGQSALPSSIAVANVSSGTRFWGALGTAAEPVTPGAIFLSDGFNRAALGSAWTVRSGRVTIDTNAAKGTSIFNPNVATHNTRLSSQSQRVGYRAANNFSSNGIFLRGNGSGPRVELFVSYSASGSPTRNVYIRTLTSYTSASVTIRATLSGPSSINGDWTFDAIGNTYTAYRNGASVLQWIDSGGAFAYGSSNTEVGMRPGTSGDPNDNLDDWFAQDL